MDKTEGQRLTLKGHGVVELVENISSFFTEAKLLCAAVIDKMAVTASPELRLLEKEVRLMELRDKKSNLDRKRAQLSSQVRTLETQIRELEKKKATLEGKPPEEPKLRSDPRPERKELTEEEKAERKKRHSRPLTQKLPLEGVQVSGEATCSESQDSSVR